MRYGIVADIHGNLEALKSTLAALLREKIDRYFCLGDIVGYGANPRECIKIIRSLDALAVCGNHDAACAGLIETNYFNNAASKAIKWTKRNLKREDVLFLKSADLSYSNAHLTLVHGTLQDAAKFHYMTDNAAALGTMELMKTNICFVGHTHIPGIFSLKNNRLRYFREEKTKISEGEKLVVNAGSVGQPRDRDTRSCYSVYDTDAGTVELKRTVYDVKKAQKKILEAGLPESFAYRLGVGS